MKYLNDLMLTDIYVEAHADAQARVRMGLTDRADCTAVNENRYRLARDQLAIYEGRQVSWSTSVRKVRCYRRCRPVI